MTHEYGEPLLVAELIPFTYTDAGFGDLLAAHTSSSGRRAPGIFA